MRNINNVILVGRAVSAPKTYFKEGTNEVAVAKLTIAVTDTYQPNKDEEKSSFINCTAFGGRGGLIAKYVDKGQIVGIRGELVSNSYTDKNGEKKYSTEILVQEVFLFPDGKRGSETQSQVQTQPQPSPFVPIPDNVTTPFSQQPPQQEQLIAAAVQQALMAQMQQPQTQQPPQSQVQTQPQPSPFTPIPDATPFAQQPQEQGYEVPSWIPR